MKERIHQILEWTNLSQQDFANRLGISPASMSSIFTGRTNPTNNHVQAIHRTFPEINVNWLLFGEGQMMNESYSKERSCMEPLREDASVRGDESGVMASMFSDEDFGGKTGLEVSQNMESGKRQEYSNGWPSGFHFIDNTKNIDIKPRKIKEIRVFFDDGTYEAFVPSGGK